MKILGLPGVNPATKKWLQDIIIALGEDYRDSKILEYRHWSDKDNADIGYEASCLENVSVDLLIAKSFGTAVATQAYDSFNFRPKYAVLIGSPLKRHSLDDYSLLNKFVDSVPTLFIQQTADFVGSYKELKEVVRNLQNAHTKEVPGDDHVYGDIDELRRIIQSAFPAGA
jgi:hypothetical protein